MLQAPHRTTFLSGAGRHNLRGHSFIVSPLSRVIMIGGNHNHFQKESFKRSINRDSESGSDIEPCRSDSAGDGAHKA